MIASYYRNQI